MRGLLALQVTFFICWGLASGAAFSALLEARERQARAEAVAAVFIDMPLRALAEYGV